MKTFIQSSTLILLLVFSLSSFDSKAGVNGLSFEVRTVPANETRFSALASTKWIELKTEKQNSSLTFKLIDRQGIVVKSGHLIHGKSQLDISNVPCGQYQIVVSDGDESSSRKIELL